ncbi:hypothetical protein ABZT04_25180 [Streptomyces sp. NPDC005492]|uniref:hypothetical protein n=1 Tax=Streptomyces sp. NPDC005492 TaxID=3156883 RepID=UPI0033BC9656
MTDRGGERGAATGQPATNIEYRIAQLENRLASGECGELGLRVETHGAAVTVRGIVPTAVCREEVLRTVRRELAGLTVHTDIGVAEVVPPESPEDLP